MKESREVLQDILKDKDIRITRQRKAILEVVYKEDKPLTASYIYGKLQEDYPSLRLSTVYRNINLFVKKGLLRKMSLNIDNKESYFELVKGEHHHHLICIQCNSILPLDCPLGKFEEKLNKETDYIIVDHKIKIYGICPECRV